MPQGVSPVWYDDIASVGRRVRDAREERGLTQRELAEGLCTPAYVSRIEKGDRVPSLQLMREFAERLEVAESWLAYGSKTRSIDDRTSSTEIRVALRLGDLEEARTLAAQWQAQAKSKRERALADALLGQISLAQNQPREAITLIESARSAIADLELVDVDAADALGRAYSRVGESEQAIAVFGRTRDAAAKAGDAVNEVRFGTLLGHAFSDSTNFAAAEEALALALRAAETIDDPLSRARALWAQSRLHAMQNDPDTAAGYAERALEILQANDHSYHSALARQLLAHIELDRGNGDRARKLLEEAEPLINASGRPFEIARLRIEQARALLATGSRKAAVSLAMSAAAAVQGDLSIDAGRCYLVIAEVFAELKQPERAEELYELAVELLEPTPNRYLVEAYSKYAALLESRGEQQRALEILKAAMKVQTDAAKLLA
jgi:tetratricopeptide (TPR) repeat protein